MAMGSIRKHLAQLEDKQRFLDWFLTKRFYSSLTLEELHTCKRGEVPPVPLLTHPSKLDQLDWKSLVKQWKKSERVYGGRAVSELQCYATTGVWPERQGRIYASMRNHRLVFVWPLKAEENEI